MNRRILRSRPTCPRSTRAARVVLPALLTGLLVTPLAACGAGDDEPATSSSVDSASEGDPHGTAETWNPCDGIAADEVSAALGAEVTPDRGTADAPRCALLPETEGDPVLDANYMVFADGLDAAWRTMGPPDDGSVSEPAIPGADAARLVVTADADGVTATGFVENGNLIHVVNAADTSPYDRRALVRGIELAMTQLSTHASEAAELADAG
ncbi:hypothetical protein [Nocardioides pantholopis]|uniref:hypothetical protein n=1 Tax=Nocardioides pantholopis TaxID=2483798 RepID=UPI000FD8960F|nr:hypothetical protein [Nocardioides pantholopis]